MSPLQSQRWIGGGDSPPPSSNRCGERSGTHATRARVMSNLGGYMYLRNWIVHLFNINSHMQNYSSVHLYVSVGSQSRFW